MADRPILFTGENVRAINDGRKTQTRRVIKPQPPKPPEPTGKSVFLRAEVLPNGWNNKSDHAVVRFWYDWNNTGKHEDDIAYGCPYGVVGDRLWCKESYCLCDNRGSLGPCYKASFDESKPKACDGMRKWKSSRFMFKKYARIWREITAIRVEILKEISDSDIICEGFETREDFYGTIIKINQAKNPEEFLNKWVWVVEFRKDKDEYKNTLR